jgi:hypothetical protein
MQFRIPAEVRLTSKQALTRAGYHEFVDPHTGKVSYIRRLGTGFHAYVETQESGEHIVDMHIDQKHATYESANAHSGEYVGPLLDAERDRVLGEVQTHTRSSLHISTTSDAPSMLSQPKQSLRDKIGI